MPRIQVLGPGCRNCQILYDRATEAARDLGLECEVEKVTDMQAIIRFGVMSTPALVVDGAVKMSGRVPTVAQLKEMLG